MVANGEQAAVEPLGGKVKRLRMEQKISQDRLAIEAHCDQSGLSKFERGTDRQFGEKPLRRIAAILQISFEDLIAGTDYAQRKANSEPPVVDL